MIWATDCETYRWDRVVCWVAVSESGEIRTGRTAAEWCEWYISLPETDTVIAHNGGAFDFLALLDGLPDADWHAVLSGSRIIACQARGAAVLVDSFALFPLSLAKWTGRKSDTGFACVCGRKCGGYCAIPRRPNRAEYARLLEYCLNDCRILLETYLTDVGRLAELGYVVYDASGQVRRTVGSLAYHTAKRFCEIPEDLHRGDWNKYNGTREAYYGGRTECGRTRAPAGHRYDINSAYPFALTLPVPTGEPRTLAGRAARSALMDDLPGLYAIRGYQTPGRLALLPRRGRQGNLIWATGAVQGVYTGIEVLYALENGLRLDSVDWAMVWPEEEPIYKPFVEKVYSDREACKRNKDDRFATVLKWIGNSLSGKLAQMPIRESLYRFDLPPFEQGQKFRWLGGQWWVHEKSEIPANARPWHAATLTSRIRVLLHSRLSRNDWIYCDTDSTYLVNADNSDVDEYRFGAFKYEGTLTNFECIAPKLYRYDEENDKGDGWQHHVKGKGFSGIDYDGFDNLLAGGDFVLDRGVKKIRTAIRDGGPLFVRQELTRGINRPDFLCGTRYVLPSGETVSLHCNPARGYEWPGAEKSPMEVPCLAPLL